MSTPSDAAIAAARADIAHRCDGPITAFVLIGRALDAVNAGGDRGAMANALYLELASRGYLTDDDTLSECPGS